MSYDIDAYQVHCFHVSFLKIKPNKKNVQNNEEIFGFIQEAH